MAQKQAWRSTDARVSIDLRATGLLRAMAHDPTLVAHAEPLVLKVDDGAIDVPVTALFRVERIEPPADLDISDRAKMLENMRGRDVLDAARFPVIELAGRYVGTVEAGSLVGTLAIRGGAHRVSLTVRITRDADALVASGTWDGRLTDLGIKPFKALLGALKLEDWVRLRLEARWLPEPAASG
jgi:hypothetical protein